jgi:OPA family glycerol-3-phosphate transporter-like MFS transporter
MWSLAYGTGQLVNGLLTDRIGGKTAMLIGAVGTIIINLIFGVASFAGTFSVFALIWLMNGYFQSWGAPGMIKTNAAWFYRDERGTFAGIFGFMIQLGQISINRLAPFILAGFSIGIWVLAPDQWRWLFRIPPLFTVAAALFLAFTVKTSPDKAGYPGLIKDEIDDSEGETIDIKTCFKTIFTNKLIWFYALAYACTGAVRHSSDQLATLYFVERLKLDLTAPAVLGTMFFMPLVAVFGSLTSGFISDKVFKGNRAPVAMGLYFLEAAVIITAAIVIIAGLVQPTPFGIFLGCLFLILISFTVNSTHSILGTAAAMDIGGKKMAGFASGVIDSFQYYGAAIALPLTGAALDRYGWNVWYPIMAGFGILGGCSMMVVMFKQRRMAAQAG